MSNFCRELNLGSNKPMAALGKPSINRYRSDNSSYSGGDTIKIEIPTNRQGQYVFPNDSFIEGRISVSYTNTMGRGAGITNSFLYIDQSIYSIFNRMRIIHGSTVIEDVLFPNRLWTSLYDVQVNEIERRADTITKMVFDNTAITNYQATAGTIYNSHLTGTLLVNAGTAGTATTKLFDFSFVIPSGVVGSLCSKALPIGLMGASSLYIELELAPANIAFVGAISTGGTANGTLAVNSYTVSDIYYNAKIVTLPSDVNDALIQSTGGIINIPAISYKNEMKTIVTGVTAYNDKFSFQFSSIKMFLFWFTNTTTAANPTDGNGNNCLLRSITSRPKCGLSDYYLSINGEAYPSQNIGYAGTVPTASSNSARMYCELMRAFDSLTDTNAGGIITMGNYNIDNHATLETLGTVVSADPASLTVQKRFLAAIDTDRFNHSSDNLMSGTSSIGQMINLNLGFNAATTAALNLYASVMYDVLYHIEGGQMMSKF